MWKPAETAPLGAENVLLVGTRKKIFIGWRHSAGYFLDYRDDKLDDLPTHWMPLPEPPSE
jgi:hypothetical protein